jgi:DNA-binding protein YbaB
MNRIEIVALFTALDRMLEKDDVEGARKVLSAALNEALTKSKKDDEKIE